MLEAIREVGAALRHMLLGAILLVHYLRISGEHISVDMRDFTRWGFLLWLVTWPLVYRVPQHKKPPKEPSPFHSGVWVVLATGIAATFATARGSATAIDLIPAGIVLLLTLAAAFALGRFAQKHRHEIGAATFPKKTEA